VLALVLCVLTGGCGALRLAPSEQQKQNAWLHNRTAAVAAETARVEECSGELQSLTKLSELQSRAFTSYCGLPREYPPAETTEDILAESNWQLASAALAESSRRPDAWNVTDAALELGIGLCALLGGVWGSRLARFLKDARDKARALKEVVEGNELFKTRNARAVDAFKDAHQNQSPQTRQLVAAIKR
jgi:hypothetical protein